MASDDDVLLGPAIRAAMLSPRSFTRNRAASFRHGGANGLGLGGGGDVGGGSGSVDRLARADSEGAMLGIELSPDTMAD